jgi:hypothetical protein
MNIIIKKQGLKPIDVTLEGKYYEILSFFIQNW